MVVMVVVVTVHHLPSPAYWITQPSTACLPASLSIKGRLSYSWSTTQTWYKHWSLLYPHPHVYCERLPLLSTVTCSTLLCLLPWQHYITADTKTLLRCRLDPGVIRIRLFDCLIDQVIGAVVSARTATPFFGALWPQWTTLLAVGLARCLLLPYKAADCCCCCCCCCWLAGDEVV